HPGLECVERPQSRVDAERERSPLRMGGGVGEDAKAARKALDGVEQKRRTIGPPRRHLGDGPDLEARVRPLDAPQRAKLVDELDEFAQVLVHFRSPLPRSMRAQDSSLRALWSGAVPRYSSSPRWLKKDKGHGQASPHRAHRSRSGKGRQVF